MVTSVLGTATSALRATQGLLANTARNIANAGTEGYTRKVQSQETSPTGAVLLGKVRRAGNELLVEQLRDRGSERAYAEMMASGLKGIDRLSGDPQGSNSLAGRIGALADGFQRLAADPTTPLSYQNVLSAAEDLAATFRGTALALEGAARDARAAVGEDVAEANDLIDRIAAINRKISGTAGVADATDMQDERDRLLSGLSEIMNVRGFVDGRGVFNLYTADNKLLATETAHHLSADGFGNVTVGDEPVRSLGGRLGARRDMFERTVPAMLTQLDDMAATAAGAFDAIGLPLFNDGGATPLDPARRGGFAARIAVNGAVVADPTLLRGGAAVPIGDTSLVVSARRVLVEDAHTFTARGLPASGTLANAATTFVGGVAAQTAAAEDRVEAAATAETLIRSAHAHSAEVDVDEEMARMIALQTAYAANARVIQVAQQMIDELLNAVR